MGNRRVFRASSVVMLIVHIRAYMIIVAKARFQTSKVRLQISLVFSKQIRFVFSLAFTLLPIAIVARQGLRCYTIKAF